MTEIEKLEISPQRTAVIRAAVPMAGLPQFFARTFPRVSAVLAEQGVAIAGPPFGLYRGEPTETVDVEAGFPVAGPVASSGDVVPGELPGGPAVRTVHIGPYEKMTETYRALQEWMEQQQLTPAPTMWEVYLTDPGAEPDPATWRTEIFWPIS